MGWKKEFTLGKTETEAYKAWHERLQLNENAYLVSGLLDRYLFEVVPQKAYSSQKCNRTSIRKLRPVFGDMPITSVKPRHVYQHMDKASRKYGVTTTNHDFEVISHAYTKVVEWTDDLKGLIDEIKALPPHRIGDAHLFITRQGKPLETMRCNAFDSLWQRFMDRVMTPNKND